MAQARSRPLIRILWAQSASTQMGALLMEHVQSSSIEVLMVVLIPLPLSIQHQPSANPILGLPLPSSLL